MGHMTGPVRWSKENQTKWSLVSIEYAIRHSGRVRDPPNKPAKLPDSFYSGRHHLSDYKDHGHVNISRGRNRSS